jgi:hypothetical protein
MTDNLQYNSYLQFPIFPSSTGEGITLTESGQYSRPVTQASQEFASEVIAIGESQLSVTY